jgi:hypothetical protein
MVDNCNKGKSCGASCINKGKACQLNLSPHASKSLSTVAERVQARREFLQGLDGGWSPREAVKWLLTNEKEIILAGVSDLKGGSDQAWFVGVEPGHTLKNWQEDRPLLFEKVLESFPQLRAVKDDDTKFGKELMKNPAAIVRSIREWMETTKAVSRELKRKVRNPGNILGEEGKAALNKGEVSTSWGAEDVLKSVGKGDGKRFDPASYVAKAAALMKRTGMKGFTMTNTSPLPSPNVDKWPYKTLFEQAGLPVPPRYKNRDNWVDYSLKQTGAKLIDQISKEKPGTVYFAGDYAGRLFSEMAKGQPVFEKTVRWKSKQKDNNEATYRGFRLGDTVVVSGPHLTRKVAAVGLEPREKFLKGDFEGAGATMVQKAS